MKRVRLVLVMVVSLAAIGIAYVIASRHHKRPDVAIFNLVSHPILDRSIAGIKDGLAASGYPHERLTLLEVNANGEMDKLDAFANEILNAHPDVVVPVSTPVTQAVINAAPRSQDIVFSTVTNPRDVGMDSRPPNVTGVCDAIDFRANVDLIFELFPRTRTIGMVYNAGERNSQFGIEKVRELAVARGFNLRLAAVSRSDEVADAARALAENVDVLYIGPDNTVVAAIAGLLKAAAERDVPVIASDAGSVENGALAAVSVDYEELGKKVGQTVATILRTRQRPGEIEHVVFVGDTLVINQKAARQLGYTFPDGVLRRAARVVD